MNYKKMYSLDDRVAVVTGGAGLIGQEIVKALDDAGSTVMIADVDIEKASLIAETFQSGTVRALPLDITSEESVTSLIEKVDSEFGKLDVWVNNAYPRTEDWGTVFEDISAESWKANVDMHMNGYFTCLQKALEYMKKQESGSVINISSIYGVLGPDFSVYGETAMTMPAAYAAIKGGIVNLTRYCASYYGPRNIRVNCVSPGGVYDNQPEEFCANYNAKVPLGRMASQQDVASAVLFLACDASSYITGHNLVVDGGWSII